MKKNSCYIVMLVFAIVMLTAGAHAQGYGDRNRAGGEAGVYGVQGRVVLPDGTPAVNVKVTLSGANYTSTYAVTDNDGSFRFSGIGGGSYTASTEVGGFPSVSENFSIEREASAGQVYSVMLYIRNPGQKKGDFSANPLFKDVPKEAMAKYQKAVEKSADPKAAIVLLDEATTIYPQFAIAFYEKGLMYQKQNDLDNAMISFQKAIAIKPDFIDAKMNYGLTLLAIKNYELAASVFQDVMKQKNDIPNSYSNFGIAMLGMNKVDIAEKAFKYALSLKGGEGLAAAHKYLGMIYVQKKQNADAITELQKYLELLPKASDADKIKTQIEGLKKQG